MRDERCVDKVNKFLGWFFKVCEEVTLEVFDGVFKPVKKRASNFRSRVKLN